MFDPFQNSQTYEDNLFFHISPKNVPHMCNDNEQLGYWLSIGLADEQVLARALTKESIPLLKLFKVLTLRAEAWTTLEEDYLAFL
jgi:hypothetical protein